MKYPVTNANFNSSTDEINALKIAISILANMALTQENVDNLINSLRETNLPQCLKLSNEIEQFKRK